MVGHGGSSAGSYLADPTSPIPSHYASIVVTSTLRANSIGKLTNMKVIIRWEKDYGKGKGKGKGALSIYVG